MKRHRPGGDQGSAAVEFVLVLPVLLIILFAIIDFGRLLNAKIVLTQAAHEGARAAALVDEAEAQSVINRIVDTMSAGLDDPDIDVCDSIAAPGGDASVTLTYHFDYVTPLASVRRLRRRGRYHAHRDGGGAVPVNRQRQTWRRTTCRRPTWRRPDDRGAVATVFTLLLAGGVLLGVMALVVDVGQIYVERSELQSGADAAALAVARACATDAPECTPSGVRVIAEGYANDNASDDTSQVAEVCGRRPGVLPECDACRDQPDRMPGVAATGGTSTSRCG